MIVFADFFSYVTIKRIGFFQNNNCNRLLLFFLFKLTAAVNHSGISSSYLAGTKLIGMMYYTSAYANYNDLLH